jgi:hypothetical protein
MPTVRWSFAERSWSDTWDASRALHYFCHRLGGVHGDGHMGVILVTLVAVPALGLADDAPDGA